MLETVKTEDIVAVALEAGHAIMSIYEKDFEVEYKEDESPLTEADTTANEIICNALMHLYPQIPMLSEENKAVAYEDRKDWGLFWLIDPLDGTKEFIRKSNEFTVNIALVQGQIPVMGVVYAPALRELYYAKQGEGAFKELFNAKMQSISKEALPIHCNTCTDEKLTVVASKSHLSPETQTFIDQLRETTGELHTSSRGSSLKLCMVAEGTADVYPRLAPTMEWDTAAAHAVVLEADKRVIQYESGESLIYNKENLLNPWFVVR